MSTVKPPLLRLILTVPHIGIILKESSGAPSPYVWNQCPDSPKPLLAGSRGDLVSRFRIPTTHIITLVIPIINLLTKSL